jgi:hypothetical protein
MKPIREIKTVKYLPTTFLISIVSTKLLKLKLNPEGQGRQPPTSRSRQPPPRLQPPAAFTLEG